MTMVEIALIVMAVSLIVVAFSFLYLVKDFKVLIVCSIALAAAETAVYLLGYEFKWYVLAVLPFYLFSVVYMQVKINKRVNAAIKRIEEREEEKEKHTIQAAEAPHGK